MKPKLKLPGSERLKLKCDVLLLNPAFECNLRRYILGTDATNPSAATCNDTSTPAAARDSRAAALRVYVEVRHDALEAALNHRGLAAGLHLCTFPAQLLTIFWYALGRLERLQGQTA